MTFDKNVLENAYGYYVMVKARYNGQWYFSRYATAHGKLERYHRVYTVCREQAELLRQQTPDSFRLHEDEEETLRLDLLEEC